MFFSILVAILSTLLYINLVCSDFINARINPYSNKDNKTEFKDSLKLIVILIMAIFWTIVIRYI